MYLVKEGLFRDKYITASVIMHSDWISIALSYWTIKLHHITHYVNPLIHMLLCNKVIVD